MTARDEVQEVAEQLRERAADVNRTSEENEALMVKAADLIESLQDFGLHQQFRIDNLTNNYDLMEAGRNAERKELWERAEKAEQRVAELEARLSQTPEIVPEPF